MQEKAEVHWAGLSLGSSGLLILPKLISEFAERFVEEVVAGEKGENGFPSTTHPFHLSLEDRPVGSKPHPLQKCLERFLSFSRLGIYPAKVQVIVGFTGRMNNRSAAEVNSVVEIALG
jgi:hypothetical protein